MFRVCRINYKYKLNSESIFGAFTIKFQKSDDKSKNTEKNKSICFSFWKKWQNWFDFDEPILLKDTQATGEKLNFLSSKISQSRIFKISMNNHMDTSSCNFENNDVLIRKYLAEGGNFMQTRYLWMKNTIKFKKCNLHLRFRKNYIITLSFMKYIKLISYISWILHSLSPVYILMTTLVSRPYITVGWLFFTLCL